MTLGGGHVEINPRKESDELLDISQRRPIRHPLFPSQGVIRHPIMPFVFMDRSGSGGAYWRVINRHKPNRLVDIVFFKSGGLLREIVEQSGGADLLGGRILLE